MADPAGSPQSQSSPSTRSGDRPWHLGDPRLTRLIVAAVVLIYAVIFIALNRTKVKTHFVFFTVTTSLWIGFLVCLVLGALLGQGLGVYRRHRAAKVGHSSPDGGTRP
jgi:uncharacterized integral membrane protein